MVSKYYPKEKHALFAQLGGLNPESPRMLSNDLRRPEGRLPQNFLLFKI